MDRWKMYRLGFVNFWLYDHEEFLIRDGHLLLRGNNGSGKSITTQSCIPFLLDGNKSPERLDPFGSRDRKMEFYLLGDGEREEATGYLYLEFKKDGLEEYLTIGVGMRAQKGKKIDFWGFCLNDGRRIGLGDISLYERFGNQLIPLSRQKLKNLIDPDNWAESPETYKKLVNRQVFQFQDPRQYDQLIQLLIKVRTPKLSKDAFRPSAVKQVLRDSLQVLTDEDLSAMVATMERMDELENKQEGYRAALRDAMIIRNECTRYDQYMLGMKGRAYLDARGRTLQKKNALRDSQDRLEHLERELQLQERRQEDAKGRLERAKAKWVAMGEDDLEAQRSRMEEEKESLRRDRQRLTQGEEQQRTQAQTILCKEVELRRQERELSEARDAVRLGLRGLEEQEQILSLGEEHAQYIRTVRAERSEDGRQALTGALQRRREQLVKVRDRLEDLARAKEVYDTACQALDQAATAEAGAQILLRDAQQQEQQERDQLLEGTVRWQADNRELVLPQEDALALKRMISRYRSLADWSSVVELIDRRFLIQQGELQNAKNKAALQLEGLQKGERDIRQELERLRELPDPVPPRRDQIQATRLQLMLRGIPHAAFYEVVDFVPELSAPERDLLEAQLADAGLLDALVVPEVYREQIQELLRDNPDRFLLPGAPVDDPVTSLIPDGEVRFQETVRACLRGISRSDWSAETALLPDGRFRCGTVRGYSLAEGTAGFVGAAARRANKERQLKALQERLDQAQCLVREKRAEWEALDARLTALNEERLGMPTAIDLDHALEMLRQAEKALEEAKERREMCLQEERSAKQTADRIEQTVRNLSRGLPYTRTVEAYEEALDAAEAYWQVLTELTISHEKVRAAVRVVQSVEDYIADLRDQADRQERESRELKAQMEVRQARIDSIQAILDRPENRDKARQRAELDQEIQEQQETLQDAEKQYAVLDSEQTHVQQQIRQSGETLREAVMEEDDLEKYFLEELHLGLLPLEEGDLEQYAKEAAGKVRPEDRERPSERLNEALRNNYQQHNNTLLGYHPTIELIFEDAARNGMLRQRLYISLQWEGKRISLYDFIKALQAKIDMTETVLEEKDRELFENILTETISHKLRARVEESQQWTRDMTALMKTLVTSMGLTFCLDWKAKRAEDGSELDTVQLVQLLNKDRDLITQEDSQRISTHFRSKVKKAREQAKQEERTAPYADLIREVLDYRNWYEFQFMYERTGEAKKELTDRAFNRFSGGEKAMAMYVPLFAAVSAQYKKSGPQSPRLLALDEAFAGVDERNIDVMFDLVGTLDFDYIMNSQALWGCYTNVKSLDITELRRPANASVVTVLRYHWNGKQQTSEDTL